MKEIEIVKGIREWRNPKNNFYVARTHYSADPDKATQEWFEKTKKGMPKAAWNKEMEIDFYALSGQKIWPEFNPVYHIVKPFDIPKEWEKVNGIDFGQLNPTCCLWGAIDYDENVYIYREYYKGGRITAQTHARAIKELYEDYAPCYIDPSTLAKNLSKGEGQASDNIPYSVFEIFSDAGLNVFPANNDNKAGWDRVSDFLRLREYKEGDKIILKPKLFIFSTCENLIREIPRYRYAEQSPLVAQKKDPDEKQIKKEDHACDALRYLIISHLPVPEKEEKPLTRIQKDIRKTLREPKLNVWSE